MRRLAVVSAVSLVSLLTACTGGSTDVPDPPVSAGPVQVTAPAGGTVLQAPEGNRWVGIDDVVVAVPKRWSTQTEPCAQPQGDVVLFLGRYTASLDCATFPRAELSSLTIAPIRSGAISLGRRVDLGAEVNGIRLTHSGIACSAPSACNLTFIPFGSDAALRIIYRGKDAEDFVEGVFDSVTRLPSGQTTVPLIDYGVSVAKAKEQLSRAGLVGSSPEANFPHYATGTNPPAGTVVEVGEEVALTIGDG